MDANRQKEVLSDFILEFLPKSGNERKYSTNEFDYVSKAVEWVCMKYLGFRPSPDEVLESFETLGYRLLEKKNDNRLKGQLINGMNILSIFKYVEVSPILVRNLRLATKTLPPNTNPKKIDEISELKTRIEIFKSKNGIVVLAND